MCKYCDKSTEDNLVKSIYYGGLDAYIIGNELNIDLDIIAKDIYVDNRYEIEINYYPMCGRKL